MATQSHGSQVKDARKYEALRRGGASKSKAARIANAGKAASRAGGKASKYEDQTKQQLYAQAKKVGIPGRSQMSKQELMKALRHH